MKLFNKNIAKLKKQYSIKELYENIKNQEFVAGIPSIVKVGATNLIYFKAFDSENQIVISESSTNSSFQVLIMQGLNAQNPQKEDTAQTDGKFQSIKEYEKSCALIARQLEKLGL